MADDLDRPLTPEECRRLAQSLKDLPPQHQLAAEDLEMLEELVHSKPMRYGEANSAVKAMQQRLALLLSQKVKNLNALEDCTPDLRPALLEDLDELNQEIGQTRQRLKGYRFQQPRQN